MLAAGAGDRIGLDLFAAQPGAPWRRAAGAVDQRAAQARLQAAPAAPAITERGGAAAGLLSTADGAGVVHRRGAERAARAAFVVADQHVFQAAQRVAAGTPVGSAQADHGHAVMSVGAGLAVVHAVAAPAERAIAETLWQLQQWQTGALVGDRGEWAVPARDRCKLRGGRGGGLGLARLQRAQAAKGAGGHDGSTALENLAAGGIENRHRTTPAWLGGRATLIASCNHTMTRSDKSPRAARAVTRISCRHEMPTHRYRRARTELGGARFCRISKASFALDAAGAGRDRTRHARQGPRCAARDRRRRPPRARRAAEKRLRGGA